MLSLSSALPATAGTKLATHRSAAGPIIVAQGQPYHAAARARAKLLKVRVGVAGPPPPSPQESKMTLRPSRARNRAKLGDSADKASAPFFRPTPRGRRSAQTL